MVWYFLFVRNPVRRPHFKTTYTNADKRLRSSSANPNSHTCQSTAVRKALQQSSIYLFLLLLARKPPCPQLPGKRKHCHRCRLTSEEGQGNLIRHTLKLVPCLTEPACCSPRYHRDTDALRPQVLIHSSKSINARAEFRC